MGSPASLIEATLTERKAICRMLAFQAARAAYRGLKAPWWDVRSRLRLRWTLAVLTGTIHHIEQGEHHDRQADWMTDIETDGFLDRAILEAMSAETTRRNAGEI